MSSATIQRQLISVVMTAAIMALGGCASGGTSNSPSQVAEPSPYAWNVSGMLETLLRNELAAGAAVPALVVCDTVLAASLDTADGTRLVDQGLAKLVITDPSCMGRGIGDLRPILRIQKTLLQPVDSVGFRTVLSGVIPGTSVVGRAYFKPVYRMVEVDRVED